MRDVVLVANAVVWLVSGAFGLIAVIRPERLSGADDGPVGAATAAVLHLGSAWWLM